MALRRSRVRIPLGPLAKDGPLIISVERFVFMLRFENKGKLGELPNLDLNLKYFFYKIIYCIWTKQMLSVFLLVIQQFSEWDFNLLQIL